MLQVDEDKQTCHKLAEEGFHADLWLEAYITWNFLENHPKAMEPGYLNVNWNHIPGMYCQKHYMQTLVIKHEEWAHLSDPSLLAQYWEPTQEPGDFHRTFALVLCQTEYHNSEDRKHRNKFVVSVAVV